MTFWLHLYNPSCRWRGGYVTTPWQPIHQQTGIAAERVAVFIDGGREQLDTQVHEVDPADPSRDVLIFWLDKEIAPGRDDYSAASAVVTVGERRDEPRGAALRCGLQTDEFHSAPYLSLANDVLDIKFELAAAPWDGRGSCYAGSATSVVFKATEFGVTEYKEVLDAFNDGILGHDMQKRCMQVDRLDLSLPAWSPESNLRVSLIGQPYELISCSEGPVRASACVATRPFEYCYADPLSREERVLTCRLYRVISLYRGADFVVDELSVRGTHKGREDAGAVVLHFAARYFMYMDFGLGVDRDFRAVSPPLRHFRISDWFGLRCDSAPFQSYGFANSSHVGDVANPHPDFRDAKNRRKSFSFPLGRTTDAACLHLFALGDEESIEHRTGLAWYEHIFKPLRVKIPKQRIARPGGSPAQGVSK